MLPSSPSRVVLHESVPVEDPFDGAARRQPRVAVPAENAQDLLRPPGKVLPLRLQQKVDDDRRCFVRAPMRPAAAVAQPFNAVSLEPREPFVARLAADSEALAQLLHLPKAAARVPYKLLSLRHGVRLLPGHSSSLEGAA